MPVVSEMTGYRISEALRAFREQECQDERDRIYGLLGIIADSTIWPNYEDNWTYLKQFERVLGAGLKENSRSESDPEDFAQFLLDYFDTFNVFEQGEAKKMIREHLQPRFSHRTIN
jgi:hypothetical protein